MNAHDFGFPGLTGGTIDLGDFAGCPVLVVNTASECGFTPQYAGLQALWRRYRDRGLVVLGVPSNDFGAQEPGTDAEIATFCTERFSVDFPMAAKQPVIGPQAHPFYRWIEENLGDAGVPRWNFHKYLIDRDGDLIDAYGSRVAPDSPELAAAIEAALPK